MTNLRTRTRRLRALVRKESLEVLRDPGSMMVGIVLPLVLVLLFGYGLSLDIRDVNLAIITEHPSTMADEIRAGFTLSRTFHVTEMRDFPSAEQALGRGTVDGIVHFRADFERRLRQGNGEIQVTLDGTDPNKARIVLGYVQGVLAAAQARLQAEGRRLAVTTSAVPTVVQRVWYNPALDSRDFLVPGLTAIVMTLTGALLTALVMAREWERGTFESLYATQAAIGEIIVAKTVPYFGLGAVGFLCCVTSARFLFDVPFLGSYALLILGSGLYLLVSLGLGLLISSVTRNQFLATQIAVIVSFLPALMLSGFLFDLHSMPRPIQIFTLIIPARHYVTFVQTEFLAGTVGQVVFPAIGGLSLICVVIYAAIRRVNAKRVG